MVSSGRWRSAPRLEEDAVEIDGSQDQAEHRYRHAQQVLANTLGQLAAKIAANRTPNHHRDGLRSGNQPTETKMNNADKYKTCRGCVLDRMGHVKVAISKKLAQR